MPLFAQVRAALTAAHSPPRLRTKRTSWCSFPQQWLHCTRRYVLSERAVGSRRPQLKHAEQVPIPVPDEVAFLDSLLQWIVTSAENALQREALMHLIAAVVNRHAEST